MRGGCKAQTAGRACLQGSAGMKAGCKGGGAQWRQKTRPRRPCAMRAGLCHQAARRVKPPGPAGRSRAAAGPRGMFAGRRSAAKVMYVLRAESSHKASLTALWALPSTDLCRFARCCSNLCPPARGGVEECTMLISRHGAEGPAEYGRGATRSLKPRAPGVAMHGSLCVQLPGAFAVCKGTAFRPRHSSSMLT